VPNIKDTFVKQEIFFSNIKKTTKSNSLEENEKLVKYS
jgi:hypothetical protein